MRFGAMFSSPALAGITNQAGSFYSSSAAELGTLYSICGNGASTCSELRLPRHYVGYGRELHSKTGMGFCNWTWQQRGAGW